MATEISLPFDLSPETGQPQEVTEDYGSRFWALGFRSANDTGVDWNPAGQLLPSIAPSGTAFRVPTGKALVEGFYYELVTDVNGSTLDRVVTANTGTTNPRVWRQFLTLDRTANKVYLTTRAGSAAASPAAPTPTVTATVRDIPLARANQAGGAAVLTAGTLVDERPLLRYSPTWYEPWPTFTPGYSGFNPGAGATLAGRYRISDGRLCVARIRVRMGTGASFGPAFLLGLPARAADLPPSEIGNVLGISASGARSFGNCVMENPTTIALFAVSGGVWGQGSPFVWSTGAEIRVLITYELA